MLTLDCFEAFLSIFQEFLLDSTWYLFLCMSLQFTYCTIDFFYQIWQLLYFYFLKIFPSYLLKFLIWHLFFNILIYILVLLNLFSDSSNIWNICCLLTTICFSPWFLMNFYSSACPVNFFIICWTFHFIYETYRNNLKLSIIFLFSRKDLFLLLTGYWGRSSSPWSDQQMSFNAGLYFLWGTVYLTISKFLN